MFRKNTFALSFISLVLIYTMIFSACSSQSLETGNSTAQRQPNYSNATANSNASTTMASPMLLEDSQDEKSMGERYAKIDENPFLEAARAPLSTFSIDVDT